MVSERGAFATLFEQDVSGTSHIICSSDKDPITWDYDSQMTEKYFAEYIGIEVKQFRETLLMQSRESKVVSSKALDASLVVTECSGTKGRDIDQDAKQYQAKSPFLKVELVKSKEMIEKETYNELSHTAQIQEKVFANAALKNELRKLKGNSMDTKFAKPSILGKPVLQPLRNQSVVRQPNAFKSKRPNFLKPRFASQVDENNILSKPVTPHYLPKVQEYVLAKTIIHVIAPAHPRNIKKTIASLFNDKMTFKQNGSSLVVQSFMTSVHISSGLALQQHMASANNTPGLAPQRKERCTLQCTLSLEEEKIYLFNEHSNQQLQYVLMLISFQSKINCASGPQCTPNTINSRTRAKNLVSPTPYVPPSKKDYEILFQPLFDEYFNPPPRAVSLDPVDVASQELLIQLVQLRQLPLINMQKRVNTYALSESTWLIADLEEQYHGPSEYAGITPPSHSKIPQRIVVSFLTVNNTLSIVTAHTELVILKRCQSAQLFPDNNKTKDGTIESRAHESSINRLGHYTNYLNIRVDAKVHTMKMEILLEPTSNKLLVGVISDVAAAGQDDDNYNPISQMCEHAGPKGHNITWRQYFTTRMIKRFTMADDLKESSKITQVKGTMLKDHYLSYKDIT
ncbi:hypothetical protein Tco_0890716 [Tanacetum coccineum]|uniref:Uncharacterized protein n=1 Tax=Tanacetum coccineum TaxID=301880 RepID=A0ABQ5C2S5_9ASTR